MLNSGIKHSEVAKQLGKSEKALRDKLSQEGYAYKYDKYWSGREFKFLKDNWQTMTDKEIAEKLHRPLRGVQAQRRNLGLFRTKN
jgi:hypothetical protein